MNLNLKFNSSMGDFMFIECAENEFNDYYCFEQLNMVENIESFDKVEKKTIEELRNNDSYNGLDWTRCIGLYHDGTFLHIIDMYYNTPMQFLFYENRLETVFQGKNKFVCNGGDIDKSYSYAFHCKGEEKRLRVVDSPRCNDRIVKVDRGDFLSDTERYILNDYDEYFNLHGCDIGLHIAYSIGVTSLRNQDKIKYKWYRCKERK